MLPQVAGCPACRLARLGYHILLEKPIAPTRAGCVEVIDAVDRAGVILAVCHVLRYTAYTDVVKRTVDEGRLGRLVGVDQVEPVGWWHFAHSYVRGNWRRADRSGPSVLTKCCHDFDWLRYIVGRPAVCVSSTGGLHHFTAANRLPRSPVRRLLPTARSSRTARTRRSGSTWGTSATPGGNGGRCRWSRPT